MSQRLLSLVVPICNLHLLALGAARGMTGTGIATGESSATVTVDVALEVALAPCAWC
jgi:hypothetical protein